MDQDGWEDDDEDQEGYETYSEEEDLSSGDEDTNKSDQKMK